jgi:hypothetical protein
VIFRAEKEFRFCIFVQLECEELVSAIASKIDCKSREFRANQAAMRALIAELETRRATVAEGGPPRASAISRAASFCRGSEL